MALLQSIREGKYDAHLDAIVKAVNDRKADRVWALNVGDKVRISRAARPSYIAGKIGTIKELRRSRILVILDNPPVGTRFSRGILCHLQSLEPVGG